MQLDRKAEFGEYFVDLGSDGMVPSSGMRLSGQSIDRAPRRQVKAEKRDYGNGKGKKCQWRNQ